MKRSVWVALLGAFILGNMPAVSDAKSIGVWTGTVEHISTDNIKVFSWKFHKTLSFLLVPRFNRIFSADGKTTYQMEKIKQGMTVKVYYDQHLLGTRHADRILVIGGNDIPAMTVK